MNRPKVINFTNGEKHFQLRIEYWWFQKGKIFPRYHPTYILSGKTEIFESDQIEPEISFKETLRFLIKETIDNLFAKLNTFWR